MVGAPRLAGSVDAAMASRRLDRRTVVASAVIALMGASIAALITLAVLGDDSSGAATDDGALELTDAGDVDVDRLLAATLTTPEGEATDLGAFLDGRAVLVNFWQSSCAPCITEMPLLDDAATDRSDDLAVVGIATLDRPDDAADLADQTGIAYPWVLDDVGTTFSEAQGAGMPTTLLLDADGRVLASETGAFSDAAELDDFLDDHLPS